LNYKLIALYNFFATTIFFFIGLTGLCLGQEQHACPNKGYNHYFRIIVWCH